MKISMFTRFLTMAIAAVALGTSAFAQVNSDIPLAISDAGSNRDTLRWGVNTTATHGRDAALGEEEQPPAPPEGVLDARWINVIASNNFGQGIKKNFRNSASPTQRDTFRLKVQPGSGGYPMKISWPAINAYFGSASLRFVDGDGNATTMDMTTGTEFTFNNPSSASSTITITTMSPLAPPTGVSATPNPINFGVVNFPTPGEATQNVVVTNLGGTVVTIDSVRSNDTNFVISGIVDGATITGNGTTNFNVKFVAPGSGSFSGAVRIYHSENGSPAIVPVSATASSGLGIYFVETHNRVFDNRANFYREYVGLKHANGTPLQGLQFKVTATSNFLRLKSVVLGPSINPVGWNFDYELVNAASGSELKIVLYGQDTTINLPAGTYDSLFIVNYDVKDVKVCNGGPGGDSVSALAYLHSVESVLATELGESAGVGVDNNRDTTNFYVHNSSSRGDVNCDDRVDVLDVLEIIDVVLGRKTFEAWQFNRADLAPWSPTWTPSGVQIFDDANNYGDGKINVQDVVLIVNAILNEQWPDDIQLFRISRDNEGETGAPDFENGVQTSAMPGAIYDVKFLYNIARNGVNVDMHNLVPVKGIQMKLKANEAPENVEVKLNEAFGSKFTVSKLVKNGEVRLMVYSMTGDAMAESNGRLIEIPFSVVNEHAIDVIEPITVGGTENQPLLVEYEVVNTAGVNSEVARSFRLESAPNPFKNTTTIGFSLKNSTDVSVVITDAKGAEIARLVDGRRNAGDHTVVFNAENLPNGTYFCTLTANGATAMQKLVVNH